MGRGYPLLTNNVMRHNYKALTDDAQEEIMAVKDMGLALHEYINALGTSHEISLAKIKVEEAVMWAVKHTTG